MRQGNNPLISDYTARILLSDYIDDPIEESKRINQERDEAQAAKAKEAQAIAAAQNASQPQPQAQPSQDQGAQAISPPGMEAQNILEGQGVPSSPGEIGGAGAPISAAGFGNQAVQQSTGSPF